MLGLNFSLETIVNTGLGKEKDEPFSLKTNKQTQAKQNQMKKKYLQQNLLIKLNLNKNEKLQNK